MWIIVSENKSEENNKEIIVQLYELNSQRIPFKKIIQHHYILKYLRDLNFIN